MEPAGLLAVVNPPGASNGLPPQIWIAAVVVILIVGAALSIRRRRK
ncbi:MULTISPECIES: hypothetical protein [unclassified Curtobacterium]|jgi:hypothetical protein|nr:MULTISPECIES: hypothetical protein [unclassified Curtobacterium]MBF4588722.1 hypothetical protein [Curtobacterium sp. VKM Ac-1395]MCY1695088.1 hypothetical protein [Curtobacterium sp. SL109]